MHASHRPSPIAKFGSLVVVFSPQIIQNFQRSSADALSIQFIIVWLLGDVFNIIGAIMQGVLPTMVQPPFPAALRCSRFANIHHHRSSWRFTIRLPISYFCCNASITAASPGKTTQLPRLSLTLNLANEQPCLAPTNTASAAVPTGLVSLPQLLTFPKLQAPRHRLRRLSRPLCGIPPWWSWFAPLVCWVGSSVRRPRAITINRPRMATMLSNSTLLGKFLATSAWWHTLPHACLSSS